MKLVVDIPSLPLHRFHGVHPNGPGDGDRHGHARHQDEDPRYQEESDRVIGIDSEEERTHDPVLFQNSDEVMVERWRRRSEPLSRRDLPAGAILG